MLAEGMAGLRAPKSSPPLASIIFRFLSPTTDACEGDHDRRTDAVIAAINRSGETLLRRVVNLAWPSRDADQRPANWRTNEVDVGACDCGGQNRLGGTLDA